MSELGTKAVALHYDGSNAPTVSATGEQEVAERIIAIAREYGVPLYENPEIAYTNAGLCLYQAGDLDKAESYLRRALQINPRVGVALLRMADITYQSSRYLPARAYLQRYTEVGPHTPESLWLGFRIEDELGDRDTASKYAMLLEANFPDSREVRLLQENRQR